MGSISLLILPTEIPLGRTSRDSMCRVAETGRQVYTGTFIDLLSRVFSFDPWDEQHWTLKYAKKKIAYMRISQEPNLLTGERRV